MKWLVRLETTPAGVIIDDAVCTAFDDFLGAVARESATRDAIGSIDEDGWELTVALEAVTAESAIEAALAIASVGALVTGLPDMPFVDISVVAEELDGARRSVGGRDFVGSGEVLEILNISKQRLSQLRRDGKLPVPLAELQATAIWRRWAIEQFVAGWDRGSGRRRPWPLDMMSRASEITLIKAKRDSDHPNVVMIGVWLEGEDQDSPPEMMRVGSFDGARRLATEIEFVEVRNIATGVIRWLPKSA
jgi:hypothetical protein